MRLVIHLNKILHEGIDADSSPTQVVLEIIGGAVSFRPRAADVEEEAIAPILEEVADDELFVEDGIELLLREDPDTPFGVLVTVLQRATGSVAEDV